MNNTPNTLPQNETLICIDRRHSARTFLDQPVPEQDIKAILCSANNAPSAHNQQSWRFVVMTGDKKNDLAHLVTSHAARFPRPACALLRMAARSIVSAPVVIAIVNTGELIEHGTELFKVEKETALEFFRTMEIQSSAAAVENLLIAATSLGLSTVWLGILFLIKDDVRDFLGEAKGEFMAVIPVGYAAKPTSSPKKVPIEQVVKYL